MSVNHSVYKCGFRRTKKWLINLTNSVCMTAKNMTNFRPWRRECDNNTFIAIFMSVASRILQILWPNQVSTFWQCTENSICGTLIGCCCQNFSLKHFALAIMVMLQRDRMNNCREFRSSYGSDKQAFDILLQNIEQFCQGMQIRCKYKIQVSSFTVEMTWSFNPDILRI